MKKNSTTISTSLSFSLRPGVAFKTIVEELKRRLEQIGIQFEAGPHGRITENTFEVGRVKAWMPGKRISIDWHQASWEPDEVTTVEFLFKPSRRGTEIRLEHRQWGRLIDNDTELAGWFSFEIAAPFLRAMAPQAFGDWMTDRKARRPSGPQSRAIYRDPLFHYPNFRVILSELALKSEDYLLEVGCGGGAMLKEALRSGCRAAAIDHSSDMVQLARKQNGEAITAGRLSILEASAAKLPFPDSTFTCAATTGVLGFLSDPVAALAEIRRVLGSGGRFVALGSDPATRGTPAAPEPMASRLSFYTDDELGNIARMAGFSEVSVVRRDMEQFAREVGVPKEALPLFAGPGGPFLLAKKS
ncbi:MAG: methyltransferase domain-containing protein [Ignavibacteriales bacterium]|nr:methyltransferase domain-containing protein [Ignavibacteriales bacterium]